MDMREFLLSEGAVVEFTFSADGECVYRRLVPGQDTDVKGWKDIGWPLSDTLEQKVRMCQLICAWMEGVWRRAAHRPRMSAHTFSGEQKKLTAITGAMVSGNWRGSGIVAAQVDHPDGCVLRFEASSIEIKAEAN